MTTVSRADKTCLSLGHQNRKRSTPIGRLLEVRWDATNKISLRAADWLFFAGVRGYDCGLFVSVVTAGNDADVETSGAGPGLYASRVRHSRASKNATEGRRKKVAGCARKLVL